VAAFVDRPAEPLAGTDCLQRLRRTPEFLDASGGAP
jgi:hypothetical protein